MNFLLIGGTEKAGTTALFNYFYNHPDVIASIKKETNYFRDAKEVALELYLQEFKGNGNGNGVYFEASPGYLAASERVVWGLKKTMAASDVKLVFVLRDPVDRIVSSFGFHKSRGYIDKNVLFSEYIDAAIDYKGGEERVDGISEWALQSVYHGEYDTHVRRYLDSFGSSVMIVSYDDFKSDPRKVVAGICDFAGLDVDYFSNFDFFIANKTFKPKIQFVHKLLLKANQILAPFFFRYPRLKNMLMRIYKSVNRGVDDDVIMNADKVRVVDFYRPSVVHLVSILEKNGRDIPRWAEKYC